MQTSALAIDDFSQRLGDYGLWRDRLASAIQMYQEWYDQQPGTDSDEELRLYELVDSLRTDKLTIALVGEFSRGKTELINAVFFSDYQRRLLPSTPGRTTMCPTELQYDPRLEPCVRLLPIETRKSALTVAEHRKTRINWTTLPLDLNSADQMADTLAEILRSKTVSLKEAKELGLVPPADELGEDVSEIDIPVWRHVIVNYPHRLLKQGLVILDTPGLNALGSEPELTLSMLPRAHAILFVLAADTGVTRTDLEVWKNHVCVATHANSKARIVALNKIDTLWDDLHSDDEVISLIEAQTSETANLLELEREMVFPVSAQKGLLGKIRSDGTLVSRSGLPPLETKLSEDIVVCKQRLIRDKIVNEIGSVVESSRDVVRVKLEGMSKELAEINRLRGQSKDVIEDMTEKLRKHKEIYEKEIQSFQITRRVLADQIKSLLNQLSMNRFDNMVMETRDAMRNSWTTPGLRAGMSTFFKSTARTLAKVEARSQKICELVDDIYDRFHTEHGLPRLQPVRFSVENYIRQFASLRREAEEFRNSPSMLVTEQHFVIKKFFITLVSRAREIFQDCNNAARNWTKAVLTPIYTQIQEHKIMIDRRLDNLEKIRGNHASLGDKVVELENELRELEQKSSMIENILLNLNAELPAEPKTTLN